MADFRKEQLTEWVASQLNSSLPCLYPVSGDASFRRYFRLEKNTQSFIAVDAPPENEDCSSFQRIAKILLTANINVPIIYHIDLDRGYMLISDLGDTLYLDVLTPQTSDKLYQQAIDALITMQKIPPESRKQLPQYDRKQLNQELQLFVDWFVHQHLKIELSKRELELINVVFRELENSAINQPQVFCHSDYHSRNLMISDNQRPGIIDFQDAVNGPVSFDLVSLLKDCYICWPRNKVEQWCHYYFTEATISGIINTNFDQFIRWFDLMGLHRHIRVLGIFSRLCYRDEKPQYLDDLKLTLDYVMDACNRYPQFSEFAEFLRTRIKPKM